MVPLLYGKLSYPPPPSVPAHAHAGPHPAVLRVLLLYPCLSRVEPDCLLLPHDIPHQGPALWVTRLTAMCGAVLLVDQAFQVAEFMRTGSGPGPLRLTGKSLHAKVSTIVLFSGGSSGCAQRTGWSLNFCVAFFFLYNYETTVEGRPNWCRFQERAGLV